MVNPATINNIKNFKKIQENALLPTNDIIFHSLFGTIGNETITKAFIEVILKQEVQEINLDLNLNLIREHYDSKLGVLDVRAKTKTGVNYNIEMQNTSSETLPERILSYWSRLYTGDLKRGYDYNVLAKTIAILIVNDTIDRFEIIKKYHTKWNIREEEYQDIILTDDLEIHIIELPKYIQMKKNKQCANVWLDFLLDPNGKEVLQAMENSKELKEAGDKWREITADEIMRDRALRLEIAELDRNTALRNAENKGYKKGMATGFEQIVIRMFNQKISIEEISKYTELDIEKVKDIIKKVNEKLEFPKQN